MRAITILICLATVSAGATVHASPPITGYGEVRFGDSLETVRKAYPDVSKIIFTSAERSPEEVWTCRRPVPYLLEDCPVSFTFYQSRLDGIVIAGTLVHPDIVEALDDKYGTMTSFSEEYSPLGAAQLKGVWADASGNRLTMTYTLDSRLTSLAYDSAGKIKRDEKRKTDFLKKQQQGL